MKRNLKIIKVKKIHSCRFPFYSHCTIMRWMAMGPFLISSTLNQITFNTLDSLMITFLITLI